METSTGSGIVFDYLYISVSLKLQILAQVANYAINVTAKRLSQFSLCTSIIDSLADIKALNSNVSGTDFIQP